MLKYNQVVSYLTIIKILKGGYKMKKNQVFAGIILIIAMMFFGVYLKAKSETLTLFLITGLILGYILTRSRYGFAGGIKKIYLTGDGSLTKALLFLFAISIVGVAGVHYGAAQKGAVIASKAVEGSMIIPGSQFLKGASLLTIIGGILFGIGMMLGGGCASGTLTDSGEGSGRAWIVIIFFCLGGILGHWMLPWWDSSIFGQISTPLIYLPDYFGYVGAVALSLFMLIGIYAVTKAYENKRRNEGTLDKEVYEENEKPLNNNKSHKFFSYETYHKFFIERWSFYTGSVLIAIMFIFIMTTTGSSWGASGPYTLWGVWGLQKVGVSFSHPAFEGVVKTVNNGLINNASSIRNIGIIFGSAIAFLMAGRFKFDFNFKFKDIFYYGLGGLLMGYGAKIARGCNIGGLYSGIANFSISGWVFMLALIVGGVIGLKIFAGKTDVVPKQVEKAK